MPQNHSFNNLTEEQKITLLKQLVKMAKADGVFKFVEFKYLTEVAEMMGISAAQLDAIIEDDTLSTLPHTKVEKARQIYRLAIMMEIDHKVAFAEKKMLKDMAVILNLHPDGVDKMLVAMKQNKGGMLLNDELETIFSRELNSNLNHMTLDEKITLIRQLHKMSQADQNFQSAEKKFLYELALSIHLPIEILEDILADEKAVEIPTKMPDNIEDRMIQIYRLVLMMKIDNEISIEEVNTLKSIALELGLHPESVMLLLDRLLESPTGTLDFNELKAIFDITKN